MYLVDCPRGEERRIRIPAFLPRVLPICGWGGALYVGEVRFIFIHLRYIPQNALRADKWSTRSNCVHGMFSRRYCVCLPLPARSTKVANTGCGHQGTIVQWYVRLFPQDFTSRGCVGFVSRIYPQRHESIACPIYTIASTATNE